MPCETSIKSLRISNVVLYVVTCVHTMWINTAIIFVNTHVIFIAHVLHTTSHACNREPYNHSRAGGTNDTKENVRTWCTVPRPLPKLCRLLYMTNKRSKEQLFMMLLPTHGDRGPQCSGGGRAGGKGEGEVEEE